MTWTDPTTWCSNLAAFHAAAAAVPITDPTGNVLLGKPTYRDYWAFPATMWTKASTHMKLAPVRFGRN